VCNAAGFGSLHGVFGVCFTGLEGGEKESVDVFRAEGAGGEGAASGRVDTTGEGDDGFGFASISKGRFDEVDDSGGFFFGFDGGEMKIGHEIYF